MNYCSKCGSSQLKITDYGRQCESCQKEFYNNPKSTAGIVITIEKPDLSSDKEFFSSSNSQKVLLAKRNINPGKGQWAIVAGFVNHTETLEQAIIREVQEELQLDFDQNLLSYIGSWNHSYQFQDEIFQTLMAVFGYEISQADFERIVVNEENSQFQLFDIVEVTELESQGLLFRDNYEIISRVLGKSGIVNN